MTNRFAITIEDEIEDLEARLDEANGSLELLRQRCADGEDVDEEDFDWVKREIEECEEALAELRGDAA